MRVSVAPNLAHQFPIYDAAAVPARTTVYGLPSLAATSIASRTPFVVCVPIASATPPSLQDRACFTNTLRVITAFSVPHSVADSCAPTPSGSYTLRHGHSAKPRFTPIPSVCTASSRHHACICRHAFGLSACHMHTSLRHLCTLRISASLAYSAGRIVKERILASRCHPLCWGRPSSVGVRATSDERNANG